MAEATTANREVKDGMFRLLFSIPENAAELYNALTNEDCTPDEIQIITITTVISGRLKNDLAFVVRGRVMVVGEHMASPYLNMPVRMLIYIGQLYDKWVKMRGEEKFLYGSKQYTLPTPEFVIFYNGETKRPEKEIIHLSSAFATTGDNNLGHIELSVPVYNINDGMNPDIFTKSTKLKQYATFVAKLREFIKEYNDYNQAVKNTVTHCIKNNVLTHFLNEHGGAIMSILETPYDEAAAKRVYAEEMIEDREIEMATEMLADGVSIDKIIKWTRLPLEEINKLREMATA